jgi:hypothetical protein
MDSSFSNYEMSDFYTPLDVAVEELHRRQSTQLREQIESELPLKGDLERLFKKPYLVIFRQVATPINEIIRVFHIAKIYNLEVVIVEYIEDKFTPSLNPYKYGLGKLPIYNGNIENLEKNIVHKLNIVDFARMEGKPLSEVMTHKKEKLVDIHHELFEDILKVQTSEVVIEASYWLLKFKGASEYYQEFFKLFLAHNILAEIYQLTGEEEGFTRNLIVPILKSVSEKYGVKPLIWHYLEDTPENMNYYWECYPKHAGDLLKEKGYY